jgi:hypothetical protein
LGPVSRLAHGSWLRDGDSNSEPSETNAPIQNDGLWGLRFGNGGNGGDVNTLFFSAGINDEQDGLFGTLQAVLD